MAIGVRDGFTLLSSSIGMLLFSDKEKGTDIAGW
jgi:hypothetical protein